MNGAGSHRQNWRGDLVASPVTTVGAEAVAAVRAALQALTLDVPADALERAALVAAMELGIAAKLPELVTVAGAEWVTLKAGPSAGAVTVGSLARGVQVLAGVTEGPWRPIYGQPIGWA